MAKLSILAGATSVSVPVFVQDSSKTDGSGLTGLVYNSSGLTAYYALPRAAAVAITLATLAAVTSSYSSGGFKEIDATNMPGWYRLDVPNAALASGRSVGIHLKGATNMAPLPLEVELTGWDNQDGVRGGMTALPNAAAEAAGGLFTRGTGAGQIRQDANGRVDANAKAWVDGTIPAVNVTGVPKVDLVDWLGSAPNALVSSRVDVSAGAIAANAITATSIAADAIGASELAADAVTEIGAGVRTELTVELARIDAAVTSRSTVTTGQVLTQCETAIATDTIAELAQAAPPKNPTLAQAVMLLYMALRNQLTQTSGTMKLANDAGTVIAKSATSDDGTTFTRGQMGAGP